MVDSEEVVEAFTDFANALEAACVNLKRRLGQLEVSEGKRWTWNPDGIKWNEAEGAKGKYERSEDVNSRDFKALVKDLAERGGKLSRDGVFYWLFKNGHVAGRKTRPKK